MRHALKDATAVPLPTAYQHSRATEAGGRRFACLSGTQMKDWFLIENAVPLNEASDAPADVYIYDEIGFWGTDAQSFVETLKEIGNKAINVHINSPGGEAFDGVAIYNALLSHPADVTVLIDGLAASAASFIAQSANKLIMSPGSMMMIHDASAFVYGNEQDMVETARMLSTVSNSVASIYAARAGEDAAFWREFMRNETWYSPEEAVAANLADEVAAPPSISKNVSTNRWDLSLFNHKGRSDAPAPSQVRQLVTNKLEARMADKPKNTGPEADKPADAPVAPAETPAEETPADETPAADDTTPAAETPPEETPVVPTNRAGAHIFDLGDGSKTTDPAKVQQALSNHVAAAKETKVQNRKAFVKKLSDDKKILASQIPQLEKLVLDEAFSDEQWSAWSTLYTEAPAMPLLSSVSGGHSETGGPTTPESAAVQEIEDAAEIVKQHQRSHMPKEQMEATPSYLKLKKAGKLQMVGIEPA